MKEALKFPSGQFTHSQLAEHNGQTNQQVWVRYQEAIKNGIIKYVGDRKNSTGRGKPSKLYELVSGTPQPIVASPTPPPVVVVNIKPSTVPTPPSLTVTPVVAEPEPVVMKAIMPPEPVIEETTPAPSPVEVLKVEPEIVPGPIPKSNDFIPKMETPILTELLCPVCNLPMYSMPQAGGISVRCNQPLEVCKTNENPKGHGKTAKDAYGFICSVWGPNAKKSSSTVAA